MWLIVLILDMVENSVVQHQTLRSTITYFWNEPLVLMLGIFLLLTLIIIICFGMYV